MEAGREPIIRENRKINKPRAQIALDPVPSYRDFGCNYFYSANIRYYISITKHSA